MKQETSFVQLNLEENRVIFGRYQLLSSDVLDCPEVRHLLFSW